MTGTINERGIIATEPIKRIIKEHYEQFYGHRLDNLGEMFLKRFKLAKLT